MRVRIKNLALVGTDRNFLFQPGLNLICGSIFTGKTTLINCLRGLLGSSLSSFSREARTAITNLSGEIILGEKTYNINRPFTTTRNAKVAIAGEDEALRIPALQGGENEQTYGTWLLGKLGLPVLRVPEAPTKADSDTSLLSVNDFLSLCYLNQDEIDKSVFGHTYPARNIKRKYAFEVIYGKYDVEMAGLQEKYREIITEIRRLSSSTKTIEEFLEGTAFQNRASILRELNQVSVALQATSTSLENIAPSIVERSDTSSLRSELLQIQSDFSETQQKLRKEISSINQKESLIAQLRTQSARLTKSIVAGNYLLDFDFLSCPRCGSEVSPSRTDVDTCYLCLQAPEPRLSPDAFVKEQERLERQISETEELVDSHKEAIRDIESSLEYLRERQVSLNEELNHRTRRFVSERAEEIAQFERHRTQLQEREIRLREYLSLFEKQDAIRSRVEALEIRLEEVERQIDQAKSFASQFNEHIAYLDRTFREIAEIIGIPSFEDPGSSMIDRSTYLPIFQGRSFDELQSPGQKVMVNVAHALAHQLTCINFNLPLPNILFIDGLSKNQGYRGFDYNRIEAMYEYIASVAEEYKERLQIIVADNTIPVNMEPYRKAQFEDDDKLIPREYLQSERSNGDD